MEESDLKELHNSKNCVKFNKKMHQIKNYYIEKDFIARILKRKFNWKEYRDWIIVKKNDEFLLRLNYLNFNADIKKIKHVLDVINKKCKLIKIAEI